MQHWRSLHLRWLGGTLVFSLLVASYLGGLFSPVGVWRSVVITGGFVLSFLAAVGLGVVIRHRSWVAGPPIGVLLVVITLLLLPESGPAQGTAMGPMTAKDSLELFLVLGGALLLTGLAVIYAALAAVGIRIGRRHGAVSDASGAPG